MTTSYPSTIYGPRVKCTVMSDHETVPEYLRRREEVRSYNYEYILSYFQGEETHDSLWDFPTSLFKFEMVDGIGPDHPRWERKKTLVSPEEAWKRYNLAMVLRKS